MQEKTKQLQIIGQLIDKKVVVPKEECLGQMFESNEMFLEETRKTIIKIFNLIEKTMWLVVVIANLIIVIGFSFYAFVRKNDILFNCLIILSTTLTILFFWLLAVKMLIKKSVKGEGA